MRQVENAASWGTAASDAGAACCLCILRVSWSLDLKLSSSLSYPMRTTTEELVDELPWQ